MRLEEAQDLAQSSHEVREDEEPDQRAAERDAEPHLGLQLPELPEQVERVGEQEQRNDRGQREDDRRRIPQRIRPAVTHDASNLARSASRSKF
jgi:hypothetical protein